VVEGACSRIRRLPQAPSTILRMVPLPRWGRTGAPVMRAHPCQPLTFLADICRRPASEKPFLRLVAGHPAVDAAVPTAALNKKPPGGIAAWIQGREGCLGRPGWVCFRNGCQSPLPTQSGR
jgi:hypothetical protein